MGWIALLAPFALDLVAILRAGHTALLLRLYDDGFYYIEIAARLSRGQGSTFDGIHATNGYQPLWQFSLVPLAWFFRGDALTRAVLIAGLVCSLVAVLLVIRIVWRLCGPGPALCGGVVATQLGLRNLVSGMEGPAVLLAIALLLTALAATDRRASRRRILVGLASAVLVLARLDFAVLIGIVPLALWLRSRSWRALFQWCAGFALVALPFGAWWLSRWHHVLSTSATVKDAAINDSITSQFGGRASFGYARFVFDQGRDYLTSLSPWKYLDQHAYSSTRPGSAVLAWAILLLAGLGAATATSQWRRARAHGATRLGSEGWAITVGITIIGAKAALDLAVAPLWATSWYSAPQSLGAGFLFGSTVWMGVRWLWQGHKRTACVAVAAVLLAAFPANAVLWLNTDVAGGNAFRGDWRVQIDLAATWIANHGPRGIYGAQDAGVLGHQLDGQRAVVNLDGLVNNYEFASLVTHHASLRKRISASGVDYLVNRLSAGELRRFGCGRVLWTSPETVPYSDALEGPSVGRVYVIDVRTCPAT